jgi:hypothetical protein
MAFPGWACRGRQGAVRRLSIHTREKASQHRQPASVTKNGRMLLRPRSYPELGAYHLFSAPLFTAFFASFLMTWPVFSAGSVRGRPETSFRKRWLIVRESRFALPGAWKRNLDSSAGVDSCPRLIGYRWSQARLARTNVATRATRHRITECKIQSLFLAVELQD